MSRNTAALRIAEKLNVGSNNPQWLDRRANAATTGGNKRDNRVRVTRYWPGKAPDWAPEEEEESENEEEEEEVTRPSVRLRNLTAITPELMNYFVSRNLFCLVRMLMV